MCGNNSSYTLWILVKFFSFKRLLFKLSNDYLLMLFGLVFWEKFDLEAAMVKTRFCFDVIEVLVDFMRMLGTNSNFFCFP